MDCEHYKLPVTCKQEVFIYRVKFCVIDVFRVSLKRVLKIGVTQSWGRAMRR